MMANHLLYSYRRCPYALRARMALISAKIQCDVHEIDFKNKPAHLLEVSPKGTVPVLVSIDGDVIDESLDIMHWAFKQHDPDTLYQGEGYQLIFENDTDFKSALDRYKYPDRFPEECCDDARNRAQKFLEKLDALLRTHKNISSDNITMTDIAIFPFVRQCANVDRGWFDGLPYDALQLWLSNHVEGDLFRSVFTKKIETPYLLI